MAIELFNEVKDFVEKWQVRNEEILRQQMKKYGVGITDALYQDLSHKLETKTDHLLTMTMTMLRRGRFVDMGVGKGVPLERVKAQRTRSRGAKRKRRPKKWYSKAFYGRLNDLQGVIGIKVMEEANKIVVDAIEEK